MPDPDSRSESGPPDGPGEEAAGAGGTDPEATGAAGADEEATGAGEADPEAARERVVEALARSAQVYGLKRSYGRLYGILFFAEEPVSLDELVAESGYAKSTVSTAMKALERFHFVRRRSVPGEGKKAYFEAETDLWYVVQQILDQEARREIEIMTRALDDAEERLERADAEADLRKVRRLKRLYATSERAVNVLTSRPMDRVVEALGSLRGE